MSPASFDGLHASSFDAYSPAKWSSNVFTRERLEVKQKMLSLARAVEPSFEKVGLTVQRYASDEYPSHRNGKKVEAQWVFFWRTEEERLVLEREVDLERTLAATIADPTPMTRHAFVCLRLDHEGLELSLRLHRDAWVDRHNLVNKLAESTAQEELTSLVSRLPDHAAIAFSSLEQGSPKTYDADTFRKLLTTSFDSESGEGFLLIGAQLNRDRTIELGAGLVDFLSPMMLVVSELYRFVAWSASNDFISADEEFLERRAQRGERRKELEAHEAERRVAHEAKRKEQMAARQELEELFRREAKARAAAPRKPRPSSRPEGDTQSRAPRDAKPRAPTEGSQDAQKPHKPYKKPPPTPSEPQPVVAGHLARVSRGPLAGQVGVVQEVDAKGTARIMVGLLATRIPLDDLIGLGPPTSQNS